MSAMPTNRDTLAFSPVNHPSAERIYYPGDFMARDARIRDSWPAALDDDRIAVAHAARMNLDAHLTGPWIGNLQVNKFESGSSRGHLGGSHGFCCSSCCHNPPNLLV
jgi:hypothetical protein